MFGIGSTELLVILLVALVVLGPSSLAKVSRMLGKAMGEFRKVSTEFQRTLNAEVAQEEKARSEGKKAAGSGGSTEGDAGKAAPKESVSAATEGAKETSAPSSGKAGEEKNDVAATGTGSVPTPPPDSPLAQAIARTQEAARSGDGDGTAPPSATTSGTDPDKASEA
ncbi:MAG: twin-arginine translocase TatA/TatE family subunit [Desulfovibrio sp.]|jgi:sec-independent protein translocase protein TatB|nr:twin-arginine translocase TatA/TatE family subunit [Desulfovibrio sp.]